MTTGKIALVAKGTGEPYRFPFPMVEGVVVGRPNRFIMDVDIDGYVHKAHCPTTGKIGSIELAGRPVLLSSHHKSPKRKMAWTVEAISYDKPETSDKTWIGINQVSANRYVEHYLRQDAFFAMVHGGKTCVREKKLGDSRIDFRVGDTWIEVKTPVQVIQKNIPDYIKVIGHGKLSGGERLVKHVTELGKAKAPWSRVIMLTCFLYAPDYDSDEAYDNGELYVDSAQIMKAFNDSTARGLESWIAEFNVCREGVILSRYYYNGGI